MLSADSLKLTGWLQPPTGEFALADFDANRWQLGGMSVSRHQSLCACHQISIIAAKMQLMSVAITVRGVPDEVRDELAARAARAGQSLQEYLRAVLMDATDRPPVGDVIARARARVDATGVRVDAASILAARDADRP